jgi:lambda family phage portal protein
MPNDIYAAPGTRSASSDPHLRSAPGRLLSSPAGRGPLIRPRTRNYAFGVADRLTADFFSGSMTADQAVYASIQAMRNRARTLERDDPYVRKFLVMARNNIVGAKGIRLQSRAVDYVNGKAVPSAFDQELIERAYAEYSKAWNFSANGRLDRRLFAQMGVVRVLVDGECIVRKLRGRAYPHGICEQMVDAELLDHTLNRPAASGRNEIRMGVEIDAHGRPVSYHFLKEAPVTWAGSPAKSNEHEVVPADEIRHIYIAERPGQTRGVTWLAPTGLRAKMLAGLETAVLVNYRVAAAKMGFLKRTENYQETADDADGILPVPQDCSPGEIWELDNGLEFQSWDTGQPGAEFDPFKKSIIREVAAGLGVSYPELGNDFQGVSYSAGQIGVHSDIAFWSDLQQFWIDSFEEPVFRDWLLMAITKGVLRLPVSKIEKFRAVKFQPPRRKHIDPLKTHNAQRIALGDMTRGPSEICAENGADFEDIVEDFRRAIDLLTENNLPVPDSWGSAATTAPPPAEEDD